MHLLNIIRRSAFKFIAPKMTKYGLFLTVPSKISTCRTLMMIYLNKNISKNVDENINLDEWKSVVLAGLEKEAFERASSEEEPNIVAIKEFIEMSRRLGNAAPEKITEEQLKKLIEYPSNTSRNKYLAFLALKEMKKNAAQEKKKKQKEEREELRKTMENVGESALTNRLLRCIWTSSMDVTYNWKVVQAMRFGQPLVFDMDYNDMSEREMQNTVKQMMECEGANRRAIEPFHLYYCNLKEDGPYHKEFIRRYGDAWDNLLVTVTEKSYAEIFPRDQIVYLTSDSPNVMETFDHNKIYIIGSLVDKTIRKGVSLARAKRLKLATAQLPLERYFNWKTGAKVLTLDQMMMILVTLKNTGNWKEALEFVPKRKHEGFIDPSLQQYIHTQKNRKIYERTLKKRQLVEELSRKQLWNGLWEE
ncbi:tRNA methyltransferase 10 homolog C [Python bivittatus]|uniref:tRNA methyltransferase 10 homolog C n=1 Tax=Python bivittatus TaxID=176946 RepID=A0A9F2QWV9_PYTBI|nr:tRNA methyltransferase 10 homolog C [Python bivittatus]XP_025023095.1 tRNA methyltransferase 10 homolog C [Python bivittatus]